MPFFLKKIELYNIFNRFPLLEMGKILKFLTEDNQFDFLVIKERISQCNVTQPSGNALLKTFFSML